MFSRLNREVLDEESTLPDSEIEVEEPSTENPVEPQHRYKADIKVAYRRNVEYPWQAVAYIYDLTAPAGSGVYDQVTRSSKSKVDATNVIKEALARWREEQEKILDPYTETFHF